MGEEELKTPDSTQEPGEEKKEPKEEPKDTKTKLAEALEEQDKVADTIDVDLSDIEVSAKEGKEEEPEGEEEEELNEEELLSRLGTHFKSFDELIAHNKELEDKIATQLMPLNWAAKNTPEVLHKFYEEIAVGMMKNKGLPTGEIPTKEIKSPFEGKINPTTEQPYTPEEIKAIHQIWDDMGKTMGFVTKSDLEAKDKAIETERAKTKAIENLKAFRTKWEPEVTNIGLDWEKDVLVGMSGVLSNMGITDSDFHLLTPENIARAFNAFMMERPGGIEALIKEGQASALKAEKEKINKGRTVPVKATRPVITGDFEETFRNLPLDEKRKVIKKLADAGKLRNLGTV